MNHAISAETDFKEGVVIAVDKPINWTSADVVRKIKFMIAKLGDKKIKVGHAGTLDPLASGLLLICVGKATKKVEELQAGEKEYIADIMLGATTPSYDLEHPIDKTYPWEHITRQDVEDALVRLSGERLQEPPVYSAKMIDGKRAYDYVRKGKEVTMRKSLINIYKIELLSYSLPEIKIKVCCSKGTYIRSLAKEIGEALNSGAHLTSLRRTRSGPYHVEDSYTIEEITEILHKMKQN